MASGIPTEDPEKFGGLSDNAARAIEAVLAALVIVASVLTVYISPYFTISAVIILVLILVAFLTAKDRHATERYKAKLNQQLEIERGRQWNESTGRLTIQSAEQGSLRNAKFAMCQAIITILEESARNMTLSEQERDFYKKAAKRVKDMQQTVLQIW